MSCLTVGDLLTADEKGLLHADVGEFYEAYRRTKVDETGNPYRAGDLPRNPREWIPYARGAARRLLVKLLGSNITRTVSEAVSIPVKLADVPRPASLTTERLRELLGFLTRSDNLGKTWERLGRFDDVADAATELLRIEGRVSRGHLNILKGNLAEAFSMPEQLRALVRVKEQFSDAVLITGIRIRQSSTEASRLFSDNIIARWRNDGTLEILSVFEVKAGYRGGGEAQEQIFEWIEGRIDEGFELLLPTSARYYDIPADQGTSAIVTRELAPDIEVLAGEGASGLAAGQYFTYRYDPEAASGGARVIGLVSAERRIITARGASQVGLDPALNVAGAVDTAQLGISSQELDYLCAQLMLGR